MAHQISVFVENKPGRVERVTEILAKAKVNIRAFTVSSSYEYGVMKFLVDKPDKALQAIQAQGIPANKREILAVLMDDRPGGLYHIAKVFGQRKINIEDAYGFVIEDKKRAVLVLDVEKIAEAKRALKEEGLTTPAPSCARAGWATTCAGHSRTGPTTVWSSRCRRRRAATTTRGISCAWPRWSRPCASSSRPST